MNRPLNDDQQEYLDIINQDAALVSFYTSEYPVSNSGETYLANLERGCEATGERFGGTVKRQAINGLIKRGLIEFVDDGFRYVTVRRLSEDTT